MCCWLLYEGKNYTATLSISLDVSAHAWILSCITKTLSSILWFVSSHYSPLSYFPLTFFDSSQKCMERFTYHCIKDINEKQARCTAPSLNIKKEGSILEEFIEKIHFNHVFKPQFVLQSRSTTVSQTITRLSVRGIALFFPLGAAISLFLSVQSYFSSIMLNGSPCFVFFYPPAFIEL